MRDVLRSSVDLADLAALERRRANLELLEVLAGDVERAAAGGGERYVARHRERGKLLARERVDLLIDRDAPFLELMPLAGWGTDDPLGGATVCGIGPVEGVECMVTATDPTVRGGSASPTTVVKMQRALDICMQNRLPLVNLVESAGAELPKQADVFMPGGNQFKMLTRLSAAGIPVVTAVFGSSTAGGAYLPGMSDHTILVRGAARVYLGGPPLVKMAIDEDADEEELGGAEMHARTSGLADHLAADEPDAIRRCRQVVADLGFRKGGPGPVAGRAAEPAYDVEELLSIAPVDLRQPLDMREVLARVLDGSRFDDFKPLYGNQLVCGWGSIHGFEVGVLANNGILFSAESQKGAHFIQLANRRHVPLLFLQNITGFMVGTRYEQQGIIKDGAKLINAVSNSAVPHITLMVGASYGAGNYGMSGRAYDPRFVFTWPGHKVAVMGPKQLAGVMNIITGGRDPDAIAALEAQVESESEARFSTGRMWDDGIIDPRGTRTVLGLALSAVHSGPVEGTTEFGVWRM